MISLTEILNDLKLKFQVPHGFNWKENQVKCFKEILKKKDIVAVLPTGYGKSMIFQAAPFLVAWEHV